MGICRALVIGLADLKRRFEAHFKTSAVKGGGKGGEKVLFRLKEREELEHLRHLVAELEQLPAKVALLEQHNAELERLAAKIALLELRNAEKDARIAEKDARIAEKDARIAEKDARIAQLIARIAELKNQKALAQPEEQ